MGRTGQCKRVDILAVVAACHELLAKTNGVLALGDAVEHLKLLLRDALHVRRSGYTLRVVPREKTRTR